MKANELRIGNFINRPDLGDGHVRTETVLAIYERVKTTGPINTIFDFKDIQPIPLTEEWLLKFGFEQAEGTSQIFLTIKIDNNRELRFTPDGIAIQTIMSGWIWYQPQIKYVHQLQNLYFALKGEEFTFKNSNARPSELIRR